MLGRRGRDRDSVVALVLVACLAAGVILASDVFGSGANVETLLFGSLLLVDGGDIALAAVAAVATLVATALIGERWLAQGFDPDAAGSGWRRLGFDAALLGLIALASTAALTVVGALLVTALFVVPAATARLFTRRVLSWQLASVVLVAVEGTVGLWLSVKTDAPPGATIACVAGAVFALVALARALAARCRARCAGRRGGRRPRSVRRRLRQSAPAVPADGQLAGRRDHHPDRRLRARGRRQRGRGRPDPRAQHRPARVRAAAQRRRRRRRGRAGLRQRRRPRPVDRRHRLRERQRRRSRRPRRRRAGAPPGRGRAGRRPPRYDPHWWHDPRNAAAAVREIERRLAAADPARRAEFKRNAAAYLAQAARPRRRHRPLHRLGPARQAQAGHRPRRLRLLRRPLRDRGRRRRRPLPDHPGPALGQGAERTGARRSRPSGSARSSRRAR